jgi:nucleoside-diphosphate-sugar epimerase
VKIAVTGATGFIGGAIVREASSHGHEVIALCRASSPALPAISPLVSWQRLDEWLARSDRVDVVVHAAALRHRHGISGDEYSRVNIELTRRLLTRSADLRVSRFVQISSISVYGWPARDRLPIDESFPDDPVGPYGRSKAATEDLVRTSGVPWTIVQPSITYGPGDTNGMIDKMMRMIARHRFVVPGLGHTRVQLVYIDDLARVTLISAQADAALRARFICTYADPIRVDDLVQRMARLVHGRVAPFGPPTALLRVAARGFEAMDRFGLFSGREPPLTREKLATISVDRAYRIDTMRRLLGTEPCIGYDDGLARTSRAMKLS